jgi:UDP-N-acetylmuramoyl-L-alanyl-D-glutamate--2,6-diaminopimelate ligase
MSVTLLSGAAEAVAWLRAQGARDLQADSRSIAPGDAFIAWPGYAQDGRQFVTAALQAGASACLVEADGVEAWGFDDTRVAALPGLKAATGRIADLWWGEPSAALRVLASTGTNGKTSTAWWLAQALSLAGRRCGVVGTLGVGEPPTRLTPAAQVLATGLTTPDPLTLHRALRRFADSGFAAAALEASSIGVVEHRLDAVRIEVALLTNFTPDHLDYHADMASYWAAKRALFDWPGLRAAVLNLDDAQGAALATELAARPAEAALDLWTYTMDAACPAARLRADAIGYSAHGLHFTVREADASAQVETTLIGDYNVANVLAVLGGLRALGLPLAEAAVLAAEFTPVPGRMQRVSAPAGAAGAELTEGLPEVVVDYAHTPDALDKVLSALRPLARARGGRLWCVFGCGGNRDSAKRPLMGGIAARLADRVVITSDNPRFEDADAIVAQVAAGVPAAELATGPTVGQKAGRVRCEVDRRVAIAQVLAEAAGRDVVLIAGKGHEDYQEIAGRKWPFSDIDEAARALAARAGAGASA